MKRHVLSAAALLVMALLALGSVDSNKPIAPKAPQERHEEANNKDVVPFAPEVPQEVRGETDDEDAGPVDAQPEILAGDDAQEPMPNEAHIVCDTFDLFTNIKGSVLELSVNTDLPDSAVIMVTVSRSYWKKGNPDEYEVEYFSEKSRVGEWRKVHDIPISNEKWKELLRDKQEAMSRIGLGFGFDVESISEKLSVRMVVPVIQPDIRFGEWNENLIGRAVRMTGLRIVEDEAELNYPLKSPPVGKSPFPNLNPLQLESDNAYVVSRITPVMPSHSPADPIAAILKKKEIPIGGSFIVHETYKGKSNPWYRVTAFDRKMRQIGMGWINSLALIGQQLEVRE